LAAGAQSWYDVDVVFFRRRHTHEITEAVAYARCHGDRGSDILSVKKRARYELPERRRGFTVSVAGETVRQAFAAKLEGRHGGT
jgi:hypothetical protein